jgi:hypothetical protein
MKTKVSKHNKEKGRGRIWSAGKRKQSEKKVRELSRVHLNATQVPLQRSPNATLCLYDKLQTGSWLT